MSVQIKYSWGESQPEQISMCSAYTRNILKITDEQAAEWRREIFGVHTESDSFGFTIIYDSQDCYDNFMKIWAPI